MNNENLNQVPNTVPTPEVPATPAPVVPEVAPVVAPVVPEVAPVAAPAVPEVAPVAAPVVPEVAPVAAPAPQPMPAVQPMPAPQPMPAVQPVAPAPAPVPMGGVQPAAPAPAPAPKKSNNALVIIIIVVLLAAIGGGCYFLFFKGDKANTNNNTNNSGNNSNTGGETGGETGGSQEELRYTYNGVSFIYNPDYDYSEQDSWLIVSDMVVPTNGFFTLYGITEEDNKTTLSSFHDKLMGSAENIGEITTATHNGSTYYRFDFSYEGLNYMAYVISVDESKGTVFYGYGTSESMIFEVLDSAEFTTFAASETTTFPTTFTPLGE